MPLRFAAGVLAALLLALGLFYLLMRPPADDIRDMALFLPGTAAVSIVAGYGAYRLGWVNRTPRIIWTLTGGYALASLLTFLNVWVTARLMFTSHHDLMLATVLLLFAGGIAISLGYFLSAALRDDITMLNRAAQDVAGERLDTRVPVIGRNEIADLGRSFNRMAAQLEATAEKQRELERLRRDLIAWVGHDLRTPLSSVRAIIEALADGMVDDQATVERYLRTAQQDINSLSLLIDDLFEMAQLDAGGLPLDRAPISLADLVSDTIESFSAIAQARRPACRQRRSRAWILCSSTPARSAASWPTWSTMRYAIPAPAAPFKSSAFTAPEGVRVEVSDTGEGIEPADLDHVFEQFYRGEKSRNRSTGGAGLGLAIAQGIVEAHGGHITVASTRGSGTTFAFTLPRSGAPGLPGQQTGGLIFASDL